MPHVYISQKQISMIIKVIHNNKEHLLIYNEKSPSQKWGIHFWISLYLNETFWSLHGKYILYLYVYHVGKKLWVRNLFGESLMSVTKVTWIWHLVASDWDSLKLASKTKILKVLWLELYPPYMRKIPALKLFLFSLTYSSFIDMLMSSLNQITIM